METIDENKKFFTKEQFKKAKRARDFMHATGSATTNDLLALMRMNLVTNCPITLDDVKLMEAIFGPDAASIKGRTTRETPDPVTRDLIHIPSELIQAQRYVTIDLDGLSVNGIKFLTTISRKLYYRTAHYVSSRVSKSYHTAIDSLVLTYNKGGFIIEEIFRVLGDAHNEVNGT